MKTSKADSPVFFGNEVATLPIEAFLSRVLPGDHADVLCPGLPKGLSSLFSPRQIVTSSSKQVAASFVFAHKHADDGTLAAMLGSTMRGGVVGYVDRKGGWQNLFRGDGVSVVEARCESLLGLSLGQIRVLETTGEHTLRWIFGRVR